MRVVDTNLFEPVGSENHTIHARPDPTRPVVIPHFRRSAPNSWTACRLPSTVHSSLPMASAEQPLKKRKLYEPLPEPPPSSPPPESEATPPSPQTLPTPSTPSLSQEDILAKRRNKDEIRSVYEGYKRIKRCLLRKDAHPSFCLFACSSLPLFSLSFSLNIILISILT